MRQNFITILLDEYSQSHRNKHNKIIHFICVPLILFSIIGFVGLFNGLFLITLLALIVFWLFYFKINQTHLIVLFYYLFSVLIFHLLALKIDNYIISYNYKCCFFFYVLIFALAWIGQIYGHKIEGKKPSFLKDLTFLLIGPVFCVKEIFHLKLI